MTETELGPYCILRTEKLTTWGDVSVALQHNSRLRPTENADPGGCIDILAGSHDHQDVLAVMKGRLVNVTVRKNAVLAFEVLLAASPTYFRPKNPGAAGQYDEDRAQNFTKQAMGWAEKYFGEDNIVSAALHVDESTPHIQLIIQPLDPRGKLNASHWLDGNKKLSLMQDSFADHMAPLGLQRGLKGSLAKHSRVKRMYGAAVAPEAKELQVPKLPEKKWSYKPTLLNSLWRYGQLNAEYTNDQNDLEKTKTEKRSVLTHNKSLRQTNAEKARSLLLAQQKLKEERRTAEKFAKENARLRIDADRLRKLPLDQVVTRIYGAEKVPGSAVSSVRTQYRLPDGRMLEVTQSASGEVWAGEGKKGRSAIDLVMLLDAVKYDEALKIMSGSFSEQEVTSEFVAAQLDMLESKAASNLCRTPFPTPKPEKTLWYKARRWLNEARAIPLKLLDWLNHHGLVFSDVRGNAVFRRQEGGAYIEGIDKAFQRTIGDASCGPFLIPGNSKSLLMTDSPIDALALKSVYPDSPVVAINEHHLGGVSMLQRYTPGYDVLRIAVTDEKKAKKLSKVLGSTCRVEIYPPHNSVPWWNEILNNPSLVAPEWSHPEQGLRHVSEIKVDYKQPKS